MRALTTAVRSSRANSVQAAVSPVVQASKTRLEQTVTIMTLRLPESQRLQIACKKCSSCAVFLQDLGIFKEQKFNSCPIGCAISDPAQVFIILLLHSTSPYNIFDACISCGYYYCSILTSSWLFQHRLICSSYGEMTFESFEKIIIQQVIVHCRLRLVIQCRFANSFNCCGGLHECHLRFLGF